MRGRAHANGLPLPLLSGRGAAAGGCSRAHAAMQSPAGCQPSASPVRSRLKPDMAPSMQLTCIGSAMPAWCQPRASARAETVSGRQGTANPAWLSGIQAAPADSQANFGLALANRSSGGLGHRHAAPPAPAPVHLPTKCSSRAYPTSPLACLAACACALPLSACMLYCSAWRQTRARTFLKLRSSVFSWACSSGSGASTCDGREAICHHFKAPAEGCCSFWPQHAPPIPQLCSRPSQDLLGIPGSAMLLLPGTHRQRRVCMPGHTGRGGCACRVILPPHSPFPPNPPCLSYSVRRMLGSATAAPLHSATPFPPYPFPTPQLQRTLHAGQRDSRTPALCTPSPPSPFPSPHTSASVRRMPDSSIATRVRASLAAATSSCAACSLASPASVAASNAAARSRTAISCAPAFVAQHKPLSAAFPPCSFLAPHVAAHHGLPS